MGRILLGILSGIILVPLVLTLWIWLGHPPVTVADKPWPQEERLAHFMLGARMKHEIGKVPNIPFDEDNLLAGAHIYAEKCAFCHGLHGKPAVVGPLMVPAAPPLFELHKGTAIVGVSDDPVGETAWKISNGIRMTGMPGFKNALTPDEIWQVSLLLSNADKALPPSVLDLIRGATPDGQQPAADSSAAPAEAATPAAH